MKQTGIRKRSVIGKLRAQLILYPLIMLIVLSGAKAMAENDLQINAERVLRKDTIVNASRADVWRCWTTRDGLCSFFAADASIDLEVHGKYEIYMDLEAPVGQRGAEGCCVLSFIPGEMLSFTWNFPPSIPSLRDNGQHTFVVLQFTALSDKQTFVRLEQRGWKESADWDKGYAYFDRAWGSVLTSLKQHFDKHLPQDAAASSTMWLVEQFDAPPKRLWELLTAKNGLESWAAPVAQVDFRIGGKILTNYNASQGIGGPDTFETTILAFEPGKMLATQAKLPESVGALRVVQDTWTVYYLSETGDGGTMLKVASCGWKTGGNWDVARDFFETNNPKKFAALREALRQTPDKAADRSDAPKE